MILNQHLERRIRFLLAVASDPTEVRDQSVTFTMRSLSNCATVGRDGSSEFVKKYNTRISLKAYECLMSENWSRFHTQTRNEHPKPLKQIWNWIVENVDSLSENDVWNQFIDYKMITVTKHEDLMLSKSDGSANFRYRNTPITDLDEAPIKIYFQRTRAK